MGVIQVSSTYYLPMIQHGNSGEGLQGRLISPLADVQVTMRSQDGLDTQYYQDYSSISF